MTKSDRGPITDVLTPQAIGLVDAVHRAGSMAGAARALGVVPSALTYRVRRLEDALDVLLFDRSSRQARLTEAGMELLREGTRLLAELDAVAHRVKRVATGWEPQLTLAVDSVVSRTTVFELCESFYALRPPTRLKLREEVLSGTLEALSSGQADIAIGVALDMNFSTGSGGDGNGTILTRPLGPISFVFAVAPGHPLARAKEPVSDALIRKHRAVAVADSAQRGSGLTIGLLGGQEVLTVPGMPAKLEAQLRGLGAGFLPEYMARPHITAGRLVEKRVERPQRIAKGSYAWQAGQARPGRALQWWLAQLEKPATRRALLSR